VTTLPTSSAAAAFEGTKEHLEARHARHQKDPMGSKRKGTWSAAPEGMQRDMDWD